MGMPAFRTDRLATVEKLLTQPLNTQQDGWENFGSLKGRGVCLVKLGAYVLDVSCKLVSKVCLVISATTEIFRSLLALLFDFSQENKNDLNWRLKLFAQRAHRLLEIPFVAVSDIGKLLIGATIHPGVAIAKQ